MNLELDESDRQLVLLALAQLSLKNPGYDYALNNIAIRIDNVKSERALTYDRFRELRFDGFRELKKETEDEKGRTDARKVEGSRARKGAR